MTLLNDLVEEAAGISTSLAMLLRKAKVLATRLGAEPLEQWVDLELDGYSHTEVSPALPSYRALRPCLVQGEFLLPYQTQSHTLAIPRNHFPSDLAWVEDHHLFDVWFPMPVGVIEALLQQSDGVGGMRIPWPDDAVALTNRAMNSGRVGLYRDSLLLSAWKPITQGELVSILESVRSRVLDVALRLETLAPDAGRLNHSSAAGTAIVNNFFGSVGTLVQGDHNLVTVAPGDRQGLRSQLLALGIDDTAVQELFGALDADAATAGSKTLGTKTKDWLARTSAGAASAGGKVATAAAGGVIGHLVLQFLGLG